MDIKNATQAPIQTEYSDNSKNKTPPAALPGGESFGSTLNRMGGVKSEETLYQNKNGLNKESFLKMMTEQLKFQDPFNPVKNENFTQQMAMLSQLEQQINMNTNLEKMISGQNNHQIAALQLVGKNISADRAAIYHDSTKASGIKFKMPQDASDVKIEVLDLSGAPVRTIGLGTQNAGDLQTKWDGMSEEGIPMPSGRYSYKIIAKDMGGKEINVSTKVDGRVTGVTSSQGTVFLLVGDQRVGLNDVETIKENTDATSPVQTATAIGSSPNAVATEKTDLGNESDSKESEAKEKQLSANADRLGLLMPMSFR